MRGKLVPFDAATINKFYGLRPQPRDEYFKFRINLDVEQVINYLTNSQGVWCRRTEDEVSNFLMSVQKHSLHTRVLDLFYKQFSSIFASYTIM